MGSKKKKIKKEQKLNDTHTQQIHMGKHSLGDQMHVKDKLHKNAHLSIRIWAPKEVNTQWISINKRW